MWQIAAGSSYAQKNVADFRLPTQWKYGEFFYNNPKVDAITHPSFKYTEPHFHYAPINHVGEPNTVVLDGYFQSDRYFVSKQYIYDLFEFEENYYNNVKIEAKALKTLTKRDTIVGIHMRFGDYLELKRVHNCLGDTEYYANSIYYFLQKKLNIQFVVFSDNIQLAKQYYNARPLLKNMCAANQIFFASHSDPETQAVHDLMAGTLCNGGNIIANSSYSWWMAYLNQSADKITIAPAQWFGPERDWKTDDVYTSDMIKMPLNKIID